MSRRGVQQESVRWQDRTALVLESFSRPYTKWRGRQPSQFRQNLNQLGPFVNGRYRRYAASCRERTRFPIDWDGVKKRGAVRVPGVLDQGQAREYSDVVGRYLSENPPTESTDLQKLMRIVPCAASLLGEGVTGVFHHPEVASVLHGFFGCHFRIQWLDCYRSFPCEQVSHAWRWHYDNVPCETIKVMLCLTDAGEHRGATRFMSIDDTCAYYEAGYRGRGKERLESLEGFAKLHGLPHRPFHHEAKAGDVLIFQNNALHRAVPPLDGYRDVLTYLVLPNPVPWDKQLQADGYEAIEKKPGGYPQFPENRCMPDRVAA
ncbi:MAG: phytanoyl-CoA dioxygenase family protein [Planctomycetota bacterium]